MTNTGIPTMRSARPSVKYDAIAKDIYPARIVRFIGLGIQDQRAFQGQAKDPAFKCAIQFELIGLDATGTNPDGTAIDPRPACVFGDYYLFPKATRGKVFELVKAVEPSMEATPGNLEWYIEHLGSVVMVQVGQYRAKDGTIKNTVEAVQGCPGFMKPQIGAARVDLVGFNPYVDNEANMAAYNKMFNFQRQMLLEAHDSANIPFAGREAAPQGAAQAPAAPEAPSSNPEPSVDFDDSIPF